MKKVNEYSLTIRAVELRDVTGALNWLMDEKVSRFCPWNAFTNRVEAIRYFVRNEFRHPWSKAICVWGRVVGWICVTPFTGNNTCRAEIGYVVASRYWGNGVATMAVRKVARAVFAEWQHLERLEAQVDVDNLASQRVLKKAGFVREGLLRRYSLLKGKPRDIVIFSLLSTEICLAPPSTSN